MDFPGKEKQTKPPEKFRTGRDGRVEREGEGRKGKRRT